MSGFQFLKIEQEPTDQLLGLLEENEIGTPGKSMVYQHRDIRTKIKTIPDPYFANLYIRNRLYGTICLSKRNVYTKGQLHSAYYLRYFTFREKLRSGNSRGQKGKSSSQVRHEVALLMDGKGLPKEKELVLYAYVDDENVRSKRLIDEFGFEKVGEFHTISFSRISPKTDKNVERVDFPDHENTKKLLLEFYNHEQLVSFEHTLTDGNYFTIKKNQEVVCGVQAISDRWLIKELPGISGKIMMKVLPKLPFIGRLFNPKYHFVFLESIYCKPGYESELEKLLESVLAFHQLNSGIICLDPRSQLYSVITSIKLGIIHKIMGEKKIDIRVKASGVQFANKKNPFFVSGYDVL